MLHAAHGMLHVALQHRSISINTHHSLRAATTYFQALQTQTTKSTVHKDRQQQQQQQQQLQQQHLQQAQQQRLGGRARGGDVSFGFG